MQGIVDKDGELDRSITAIVTIHHNLVTFGVPASFKDHDGVDVFQKKGQFTYYSPSQACKLLEQNSLFAVEQASGASVQDYGGKSPCDSIDADTRMYPGQDSVKASLPAYLI